jgi:hypothetical protein
MSSNWDSATRLDDIVRRFQQILLKEREAMQLTQFTVRMEPLSANDRNPKFTITTPGGIYRGEIAQETAGLETEEELRKIAHAHLVGARDEYS